MYYPVGWPRVLKLPRALAAVRQVVNNRDKLLYAVLTDDSLSIWFCKPCLPIVTHKRDVQNIEDVGTNQLVQWRPDSSMLVVVTSKGHLLFYVLSVSADFKGLYEQQDSPSPNLRRESAELYVKEVIPALMLTPHFGVDVTAGLPSIVCIRDELMVATTRGHVLRYRWDGSLNRDYCLDLRRVPFCIDQQVSKAEPITEDNIYISEIEYSPLVGGFAAVLNDGRAAFLTAFSLQFDPNQVQGIWAQGLEDATCAALNHKHRLIAFGRKNSQCIVYCVDEVTGGLEISHQVVLSSKDFPGAPGAVTCMRWSPDGCALALAWEGGGISLWSTFGSLLMCSLAWDHGLNSSMSRLRVTSLDWAAEGYHLWMVEQSEPQHRLLQLEMVKSPQTVNPCMSQHGQVHLQGEDRLLVHLGDSKVRAFKPNVASVSNESITQSALDSASFTGSKQWVVVTIPHTYSSTNWPIRYTAVDAEGQNVAIAGRTGFAHYSLLHRKWKLFGNETQEKDFVVTGGILWWRSFIILGCYNIVQSRDEIRIYPKETRLADNFAKVEKAEAQVLILNSFRDRLVTFCSDSLITIYSLMIKQNSNDVDLIQLQAIDISALCVHPACVVSITLTCLRTESCIGSKREQAESLIVNVSGRLLLVQQVCASPEAESSSTTLCTPTVLASCVESVWMPLKSKRDKPHLTEALWLYCGAHGMRVWLPLFPRDGDKAHTFMSKRIMLPFQLKIYPLAVLFEDAIILGAENDTVLYSSDSASHFSLPFCLVQRTSQVYLHQILRQLIRRNLGYHAWEIARSCTNLPYFPHALELLLHEVLEEEATSKGPIPDALLPSVVEFIHEFPVYLQTVVQCARKTEVALWPYLFSAAGKPKELFQQCLNNEQLETAASYLLILQNLEPSAVSRQFATLLLDTALQHSKWELAKDLVRFLRAIDPNDVESPRQPMLPANKYGMAQSPPVSPHEEDLSLVLGTMQVARGRSYSTTTNTPKVSIPEATNVSNPSTGSPHPKKTEVLVRSSSSVGEGSITTNSQSRTRKKSAPSGRRDSTSSNAAEDFFIDTILQRHACRMLMDKRLRDLGLFAAHLDFHLVTWLKSERHQAARIEDCVEALRYLHRDFNWPYPAGSMSFQGYPPLPSQATTRKTSGSGSSGRSFPASPSVEDRLKALTLDILKGNPSRIHDSGYMSHASTNHIPHWGMNTSTDSSMHTVEARLQPHGGQGGSSFLSEESSSYMGEERDTVDEHVQSPGWVTTPEMDFIAQDHAAGRVPAREEVQLRYLLQLFMEAGCLEWALVLSVLLRDAMAVLRTTFAARTADQSIEVVKRLKDGLEALLIWSNTQCLGYRNFMLAIQNQIQVLNKILSSAPKTSAENSLSATTNASATVTSTVSGTNVSNKPSITPSMSQPSESLASQPVKPTLGKLRLVSAPSSSSVSPNGSSLDSLEEETAEEALQHLELSESNSGEVVEEGGCVIS
ncbi:guanine nucleotide exchange factor subunit Rich [Neocloeon triangulifer]|uniref:guanine nucleotide exchange factor subunit Rich n=1 Tax=Neocloeon triangulifer TaxID=2078957 RepID=UPI00286F30FA|nr:guanine nucleotide exchange factor subunit Rich [Neocloeon triangulifer]